MMPSRLHAINAIEAAINAIEAWLTHKKLLLGPVGALWCFH
jgi:hypothetical protein